jgi:hypothetical protein
MLEALRSCIGMEGEAPNIGARSDGCRPSGPTCNAQPHPAAVAYSSNHKFPTTLRWYRPQEGLWIDCNYIKLFSIYYIELFTAAAACREIERGIERGINQLAATAMCRNIARNRAKSIIGPLYNLLMIKIFTILNIVSRIVSCIVRYIDSQIVIISQII